MLSVTMTAKPKVEVSFPTQDKYDERDHWFVICMYLKIFKYVYQPSGHHNTGSA